jgi:hypothetical protein
MVGEFRATLPWAACLVCEQKASLKISLYENKNHYLKLHFGCAIIRTRSQ